MEKYLPDSELEDFRQPIYNNQVLTILSIFAVLGFFGNLIVSATIISYKNLLTPRNILILNWAIADSITFFIDPYKFNQTFIQNSYVFECGVLAYETCLLISWTSILILTIDCVFKRLAVNNWKIVISIVWVWHLLLLVFFIIIAKYEHIWYYKPNVILILIVQTIQTIVFFANCTLYYLLWTKVNATPIRFKVAFIYNVLYISFHILHIFELFMEINDSMANITYLLKFGMNVNGLIILLLLMHLDAEFKEYAFKLLRFR